MEWAMQTGNSRVRLEELAEEGEGGSVFKRRMTEKCGGFPCSGGPEVGAVLIDTSTAIRALL